MCNRSDNVLSWLKWERRFLLLKKKLLGASIALRHAGVNKELIIRLNDSGATFDEIANYIDGVGDIASYY